MMADSKTTDLPQAGCCLSSESRPSSEGCPTDSGGGNVCVMRKREGEVVEEAMSEVVAFERSNLETRSLPQPLCMPTAMELEELQVAVADGEVSLNLTAVDPEESLISGCDTSEMDVDGPGRMIGPKLPQRLWRKMVREEKVAAGTWVETSEWRRAQGFRPRKQRQKKRVFEEGRQRGSGTTALPSGSNVTPGGSSGVGGRPAKRPRVLGRKEGPKEKGTGSQTKPSYGDQAAGLRMVVVPEAFPEVKLSELQGEELQERLVDRVFSEGDPGLQFIRCSLENGALVVACANETTKTWLKGISSELGLGGGESGEAGVIVGEYRELLRSTKVLLRTPKSRIMATKDPKEVLSQVEKQNVGLSTSGWRVVGGKKEEQSQTIVLIIDELSAFELKSRGWRVFLGLQRVFVKTLGGYLHDNSCPAGEPST